MAKIFTTGTINQPDSGSLGQAMAERIRDDLTAHPNWDLVEEFTAAGGTVRWYVMKCLGAGNGLGADFFLVIGRTLASGELRYAICEGYNAAAHQMTYFGTRDIQTNVVMDNLGRLPVTQVYTLAAANFTGSTGQPGYCVWTPIGTSTKWWILAMDDAVAVAYGTGGFMHMGVYTPLDQLGNTFPIMMIGGAESDGMLTRNPAVANLLMNSYTYALKCYAGGGNSSSYLVPLGFQGQWQYNDKLQNSMRPVAEVGMCMMSYPGRSDWSTIYGFALGKQKYMRYSNQQMPASMAFGDAFVLNGTLWVPWSTTYGMIFDTGVASS